MCGIVGLIAPPGRVPGPFEQIVDVLSHRGPDARGLFAERFGEELVQLGHRRLSIIDLTDAANQPLEKDGLVIVFNGEIYNYKALREELKAAGTTFRTNSDTEVILEAWRRWGPGSLRRLRGMFAFALYDRAEGRLILARDPFGIKPLFVLRHGVVFAFASELKGLLPILGDKAIVDDSGVVASIIYGWLPDDFSMYREIVKLGPGRWLERSANGDVREHIYWDPVTELVEQETKPLDLEELRSVLDGSVNAHMVSDVPVAAFLSGGLDSSLISVLARRQVEHFDCFTIAFREEDRRFEAMPNDLDFAREVANAHDIKLHEITIRPNLADMLPEMVHTLDEPIGDAAAINAYLICKAARDLGIKVLLSGMGADEIFGGYRRHYACNLAVKYRQLPKFLRTGLIEPVVDLLPAAGRNRGYRTFRWAKRFQKFANLDEEQAFQRSYALFGRDDLPAIFDRDLSVEADNVFSHHGEVYAQGHRKDPINRMCHADVRMFLPGLNLAYTDRASMAASTEVRVPFVDVEVVRAAFRLQGANKIRGRVGKFALKKAAEAWLPRSIIYRPKGLFSAPLRSWIRNDLKGMVDDVLPSGELVRRGYVKASFMRQLIDSDRAGRADYSKEIWHFLTMDYWLRNQLKTSLDRKREMDRGLTVAAQ